MLLYESFDRRRMADPEKALNISEKTIQAAWNDSTNPSSLLTAGQAAFDLGLTAVTYKEELKSQSAEIAELSKALPMVLREYESLVREMRSNGRWDELTELKKSELNKRYQWLANLEKKQAPLLRRLTVSNDQQGDSKS